MSDMQTAAAGTGEAAAAPPAGADAKPDRRKRASRLRLPLMLGGVVIVAVAALAFYLTGGRYESTDDAFVGVATVGVSSDIGGRVTSILVRENQRVRAGQVLFTLDSRTTDAAARQAAAQLADVRLQIRQDQADYRQQLAALSAAEGTASYRERDRARDAALLETGVLSKQDYDRAAYDAEQARRQVTVIRQQVAAAAAKLGDVAPSAHPEVRAAAAAVASAAIQQGYTVVRAHQDGVVTNVSQLGVGDVVTASIPVFNLVTDDIWVAAAFKENQLNHMRPGELATVTIDAYPGHTFQARVHSIAPATDQTFSAIPAQNASGNWVKVVQRLTVRLDFVRKPEITLQGGLSANVKVDTQHRRTLAGLFGGR